MRANFIPLYCRHDCASISRPSSLPPVSVALSPRPSCGLTREHLLFVGCGGDGLHVPVERALLFLRTGIGFGRALPFRSVDASALSVMFDVDVGCTHRA